MPKDCKVILKEGVGEIVEKKSRFIAHIYIVETEEEASKYIEATKKEYWDARHNCYAYIIGDNSEIKRYSDDGEPGGTAGKPMLDILDGENLTNCLVIVTRYFGGTLLGTGGLVRAYQGAVREGLNNSEVANRIIGDEVSVVSDYTTFGKIQFFLGNNTDKAYILDIEYMENVKIKILVVEEYTESLLKQIIEVTNANCEVTKGDKVKFAGVDGKAKLL